MGKPHKGTNCRTNRNQTPCAVNSRPAHKTAPERILSSKANSLPAYERHKEKCAFGRSLTGARRVLRSDRHCCRRPFHVEHRLGRPTLAGSMGHGPKFLGLQLAKQLSVSKASPLNPSSKEVAQNEHRPKSIARRTWRR